MTKDLNGSGKTLTVVALRLGERIFAIETSAVLEILAPIPVTRVPHGGAFAQGVINVRGGVVPLADLRVIFSIPKLPVDEDTRILVLQIPIENEQITVGITADEVLEVVTIDCDRIEPLPPAGTIWPADYVRGLIQGPEGITILPDLNTIFAAHIATANAL
ncbi:MAG: chemotaxis protein CheW [Roseovarius sp.]|nr:chemotaxis protein CheW [Roseovarius sp.]